MKTSEISRTLGLFLGTLPLLLTFIVTTGPANAAPLYSNNFDSANPIDSLTHPKWGLRSSFKDDLLGPGNNFEITQAASHSGTSSLKFDYGGRNGMCNLCGFSSAVHKQGLDNSQNFVAESGQDLSAAPHLAKPGRIVINPDNGFSKWEVVDHDNQSAVKDKLILRKLFDGINGEPSEFNGGDTVYIARQCGVDGNAVKNDVSRRTDCNKVITTFHGVGQQPGQSIFRRVYLKTELASTDNHQKLRYWTTHKGNAYLTADTDNGSTYPWIEGLKAFGGDPVYKIKGSTFERGYWYYLEEEFKAATQDLITDPTGNTYNSDGGYRLWFAKSGSAEENINAPPLLEVTGLTLPPVKLASLWGNIQHHTNTYGAWYIDDIEIASETRIGPLPIVDDDVPPPQSPKTP